MAEQIFNSSQGYLISGPGLTVEVDESMFGNRFFAKAFIVSRGSIGGVEYLGGGRCGFWMVFVSICFTMLQNNIMVRMRMIKIFTVKNIIFFVARLGSVLWKSVQITRGAR